jgi:hypothetical protein
MAPKDLVETALRVLVAWNEGARRDEVDLKVLKDAFPSSAHLPDDELACQVIHDLSGRIFPERERRGGEQASGTAPEKLAG